MPSHQSGRQAVGMSDLQSVKSVDQSVVQTEQVRETVSHSKQPVRQTVSQSVSQSDRHYVSSTVSSSVSQAVGQSYSRVVKYQIKSNQIKYPVMQLSNLSVNSEVYRRVNRFVNLPVIQPINQPNSLIFSGQFSVYPSVAILIHIRELTTNNMVSKVVGVFNLFCNCVSGSLGSSFKKGKWFGLGPFYGHHFRAKSC